jgi:predicted ATP-grasp superfamily ATP-dependent carboligase
MVHANDKTLLGCPIEVIRLTSSKYATFHALQAAGLRMVSTYTLDEWPQQFSGPWVAKPDDGIGCGDSGYFESSAALMDWMKAGRESTHIIQPYQAGTASSICMLCHKEKAWLLSCNTQKVALLEHAHSSKFRYSGSVLNGMAAHSPHLEEVASRIAQVFPDLSGYVGADMVIDDQGQAHLLEINPRLTTSYAGLSSALGCNAAGLVIDLLYNDNFQLPSNITRKVVDVSLND